MTNFCPECSQTGKCWFKEKADEVATQESKRSDLDQAIDKHQQITELRVRAREKMCPNLNDIDPDYPGKNLL